MSYTQCQMPKPEVSEPYKPIWNGITRVGEDLCTQRVDEMQSALPGCYYTNNFFRYCESQDQYANLMTEPGHFYKPYRNACQVDVDSVLRYADLTNKGEIYNLYTRPYQSGPFKGAGTNSISPALIELESRLIQGHYAPTDKACERTSGISYNRMQCLPNYGNPQRTEHILQEYLGAPRGGDNTRDYVRRINFEKSCLNRLNNNLINKTQ